jgi:hypothetical protein
MTQTIADYVASLRLRPDLASLKKADRFFSLLESKIARYTKKINKNGSILGVGQTVKGITALQKAEDKRTKASIKNSDLYANAQVKAYNKELAAIQRKARFEHKELKDKKLYLKRLAITQAKAASKVEKAVRYYNPPVQKAVKPVKNYGKSSDLMNSHISAFRQNQATLRQQLIEDKKLAAQIRADNRKQTAMDKMHGQALYMNRMYEQRRNSSPTKPVGAFAAGSYRNIGTLAGAGIAGFGLNSLNRVSQRLEMLPISMEAVAGSAEAAAEQLKFLEELGKRVGATRLELVPEYTKFFASAKGTKLENSSQMIFSNLTSYGKVMGLDQEEMKGSFRALTQMISKQQIYAEELKGQ